MSNVILNVPDISCEHCERAITDALSPVGGVRRNVDRMKELLNEEDYAVESVV